MNIPAGATITQDTKATDVVDGELVWVEITRTFTVVSPANDAGMLRVECIDETADRFGTMGWVRESTATVVFA